MTKAQKRIVEHLNKGGRLDVNLRGWHDDRGRVMQFTTEAAVVAAFHEDDLVYCRVRSPIHKIPGAFVCRREYVDKHVGKDQLVFKNFVCNC